MILEAVQLRIKTGQSGAFEMSFSQAVHSGGATVPAIN
jgi:hypothetical protein